MLAQAKGSLWTLALLLAFTPAVARAEPEIVRPLPHIPVFSGPDTPAGRCAVDQDRQDRQSATKKKSRRGVLGWLYRYTRNIDVERGSTPLPLYLRSPLASVAVPDCEDSATEPHAEQCAVISASLEKESLTTTVPLPQLDAPSPARLADAIRARLAAGEHVSLHSAAGTYIELDPETTHHVETKNCVIDA
jgi:hypothetical protein